MTGGLCEQLISAEADICTGDLDAFDGLCEFACGSCQNTELSVQAWRDALPEEMRPQTDSSCADGACCSAGTPDGDPGVDSDECSDPVYGVDAVGCERAFAPDRIFNACNAPTGPGPFSGDCAQQCTDDDAAVGAALGDAAYTCGVIAQIESCGAIGGLALLCGCSCPQPESCGFPDQDGIAGQLYSDTSVTCAVVASAGQCDTLNGA